MWRTILSLTSIAFFCLPARAQQKAEKPSVELFFGYSQARAIKAGGNAPLAPGYSFSAAFNRNAWLGFVIDVGHQYGGESVVTPVGEFKSRETVRTFLFGPRVSYRGSRTFTPFAHFLIGGATDRLTGSLGPISISTNRDSLVLAAGGGLDVRLRKGVVIRGAQLDYMRFGADGPARVRFSAGVVFRF